jgi:alanyl-tRNA synthetase
VTGRNLVNNDSDLCIEIWNLVFIQYNAETDGTFRELPAKHVDTGMGFERACSIIQNTNGFTDFSKKPSNYATDVFQPIFRKLEELSGKTYVNIYPELGADRSVFSEEMKTAIAFRVIADHLRTLSFSIADGIMPGNNGRNYVLRRILRRAVRYGRQLGFSGEKPFFGALVETLVAEMGGVFPELKNRQEVVRQTLEQEESSFNQTLDRGLKRFEEAMMSIGNNELSGDIAFELYDTFGFPIDLTELLCSERGLKVDMSRFEKLMEQQQERSRAAQKSSVVRALDISTEAVTEFVGFDSDSVEATVLEIHPQEELVRDHRQNCLLRRNGRSVRRYRNAKRHSCHRRPTNRQSPRSDHSKIRNQPRLHRDRQSSIVNKSGRQGYTQDRPRSPPPHRGSPHRHASSPLGVARGRFQRCRAARFIRR